MQQLPATVTPLPVAQADNDSHLLRLWLHGRPATTARAYRSELARFLAFAGRPLRQVTLGDVQAYADTLADRAPATRARAVNAVKSLFAFGQRLGYLPFDVARPVRLPRQHARLAERILPEDAVHRMIGLEPDARNRAFLRLLYAGGLRISEAVGLRWRDVQPRAEGGQVTVQGKGDKVRAVLLSAATYGELAGLRGDAGDDAPAFRSRKGGALDASAGWRIVKAAAARAGLGGAVSPHWLRHAHASHALDRGAPIHLVRETLGHASVETTGKYLHARPGASSGQFLAV